MTGNSGFNDWHICDSTLPWPYDVPGSVKADAIRRHRASGVTFASLTMGGSYHNVSQAVPYLASERRRLLARHGAELMFAESADDIRRAKREGKLAFNFNFQGTAPLEGKLEMVDVYHKLGVRQILLVYNKKNQVGDGCLERTDAGLSDFGVKVVHEMNRLGILVDVSHTGYRTSMDAIAESHEPVVFSHSNAWAVHEHPRNIKDDQIRACAERGGWIGIDGVGRFLAKPQSNDSEVFVKHIDYMAQLVGPQHVGYGLDHIFYPEIRHQQIAEGDQGNTIWKDDERPPFQWVQPEQLQAIAELLLKRGYSDDDVRGIMGENYLRLAEKIWKAASLAS